MIKPGGLQIAERLNHGSDVDLFTTFLGHLKPVFDGFHRLL